MDPHYVSLFFSWLASTAAGGFITYKVNARIEEKKQKVKAQCSRNCIISKAARNKVHLTSTLKTLKEKISIINNIKKHGITENYIQNVFGRLLPAELLITDLHNETYLLYCYSNNKEEMFKSCGVMEMSAHSSAREINRINEYLDDKERTATQKFGTNPRLQNNSELKKWILEVISDIENHILNNATPIIKRNFDNTEAGLQNFSKATSSLHL